MRLITIVIEESDPDPGNHRDFRHWLEKQMDDYSISDTAKITFYKEENI